MEDNQVKIPEGWFITNFGNKDLFRILGSGIKYFDGEKEYYSTSSIEGNKVLIAEQLITYKNRPSRANMQPSKNTVWFAKMKNTLKILKTQEFEINNVILSTGFSGIESQNIDCDYLMQILASEEFNSQKDLLAEGSTQEAVNYSKIKEIKFFLPKSKTEQTQIATILSKVDEAIAQTEQLIAKYSRIKTGLMQDLLTKGIDENGNIRSEETHEFKDSPLGRIPKEWGCAKIIDIGSKTSPYLKTGPFGSSLKTEHWKEIGVPVITIGSLGENTFVKENLLYISANKANELKTYKLNVGDILFSRVADIGRSLVITDESDGWVMSSNFMRLRLNKDTYDPFVLNLIIKHSEVFLKQVSQNVPESGRSVTNSKILNSFLFPNIPMPEQNRIMVLHSKIVNQIDSITNQLSKLQSLKTGLMQDLLSGKVRVNHLIKETASL